MSPDDRLDALGLPAPPPSEKLPLNYANSWIFIVGLFVFSSVVFWPRYYSRLFDASFYLHLHAITAILWFALLVAQPLLIKKRQLKLHRLLGKLSYPVATMLVISIILLTHSRISATPEEDFARRSYGIYLQLSLAFVFAVTYGLAIWYRKTRDLHARFMVATAFTFIDPVFDRFLSMFMPFIPIRNEWLTFGFINLMLITLAMTDRNQPRARWVFPGLLVLYLAIEIPVFFQLTGMEWWQSFAAWFASL